MEKCRIIWNQAHIGEMHDITKMSCYSISESQFKIGKGQSERSVKYCIASVSVDRKIEEEKDEEQTEKVDG